MHFASKTVVVVILFTILKLKYTLQKQLTVKQLQTQFVLNISLALHNLHEFDNLIAYRVARPRRNNGYILKSLFDLNITNDEPGWNFAKIMMQQNVLVPIMTFTIDARLNIYDDVEFRSNLGHILANNNLAIVILPDLFNVKLLNFVSTSLGESQETKVVFVYTDIGLSDLDDSERKKQLHQFFHLCWFKNILNALLVFKLSQSQNMSDFIMDVYSYTPFPKPIKLLHLNSEPPSEYFNEKTKNLMGYEFKTPVFPDKPKVFKTIDKRTGKEVITGTAGVLYMEFVKKINATFVEIPVPYKKTYGEMLDFIMDKLQKREIDVGIHPFSYILYIISNASGSFPITHTNSCVVVPVRSEINRANYISLTFNSTIWRGLLLLFLLFFTLHMASNYRRFRKFEASIAFAVTLTGMLHLPSSFMNYHQHYKISQTKSFFVNEIATCIKILLIVSGLLFTHIYIAALTSLLNTTVFGSQIDTLADLRSANVTIMLRDRLARFYELVNIFPPSFRKHLLITDTETIARHQFQLNTSYAYVVYQEEWKVMRRLQTNLWKPMFRVASKLCIPNLYLAFPMQNKSPFDKPLKRFILRTQSMGLDSKWSDEVFSEIQKEWRILLRWRIHPTPITTTHLLLAWYILGLGLLLASIVFGAELLSRNKYFRCRK